MMQKHLCTASFLFVAFSILSVNATQRLPTDDPPARFVTKQFKNICGKKMAYVEVGKGDPIVFLHGNPTSSYLWRNIMPFLEDRGRLIAPDLIGMGDSDKLDLSGPNRYTFVQHYDFLVLLLKRLKVRKNVTLVLHDWGSALGFLWAYQNRMKKNAIKGIVFLEALVAPLLSFETFPDDFRPTFNLLRTPAGDKLVLEENIFVEKLLPMAVMRNLTNREMEVYRQPYRQAGEDRRVTLDWPRQIPVNGFPEDVERLVRTYSTWMGETKIPKLFIRGDPGVLLVGPFVDLVRSWKEVTEVTVKGIHFLQEDSPTEIGRAIVDWLPSSDGRRDYRRSYMMSPIG